MREPSFAETVERVRRHLHRHPELSNQERETTAFLRSELQSVGIACAAVDPTGLVAEIGANDGPTVAIRADIDALPLTEQTGLPFASERDGVMHACGHDAHAAMVLGVALRAEAQRSELPGRLRIIFQPAEEFEPLGARAVISQGHLQGVDAIIALHVDPTLDAGRVSLREGALMSGSDVFNVTIAGESSHAGWPQHGRDALLAAATFIQQSQLACTREMDPRNPLVVNVGLASAGDAENIVPASAELHGVVRSLHQGSREQARAILRRVADGVALLHDVKVDVVITEGEPILHNSPLVVESMRRSARRIVGEDDLVELDCGTLNGEDFSFYLEHLPGAMAWLGVRNEGLGFVHPLHHPRFGIDESALPIGVDLLFDTAVDLLHTLNDKGM